jgi:hypothetical protein
MPVVANAICICSNTQICEVAAGAHPVGATATDPSCASGRHVSIAQSRCSYGPYGELLTAWVMMELLVHSQTLQPVWGSQQQHGREAFG